MEIKNTAVPVSGMQSLRVFVVMVQQRAVEISAIAIMCAIVGRKNRMTNKDIEDMKNKINELSEIAKRKSDESESLKAENKALKQRIKDLEDVCDGICFSDVEPTGDMLLKQLQNQHQQDCICINDLTTTVHVLAGLYSTLRKNTGMD